jgi:NACalpha-BTF3-like transcription factor
MEEGLLLLECPVCYIPFSDKGQHRPKAYKCGHSLCGECHSNLKNFQCIICRGHVDSNAPFHTTMIDLIKTIDSMRKSFIIPEATQKQIDGKIKKLEEKRGKEIKEWLIAMQIAQQEERRILLENRDREHAKQLKEAIEKERKTYTIAIRNKSLQHQREIKNIRQQYQSPPPVPPQSRIELIKTIYDKLKHFVINNFGSIYNPNIDVQPFDNITIFGDTIIVKLINVNRIINNKFWDTMLKKHFQSKSNMFCVTNNTGAINTLECVIHIPSSLDILNEKIDKDMKEYNNNNNGPLFLKKDDIDIVMQQTDCTRDEAVQALEKNNGDIVSAIMYLQF